MKDFSIFCRKLFHAFFMHNLLRILKLKMKSNKILGTWPSHRGHLRSSQVKLSWTNSDHFKIFLWKHFIWFIISSSFFSDPPFSPALKKIPVFLFQTRPCYFLSNFKFLKFLKFLKFYNFTIFSQCQRESRIRDWKDYLPMENDPELWIIKR